MNWLLPIAGFQWYDTNVKTMLTDVTFKNYEWTGDGNERQAVWLSMVHSDKFKPSGISLTKNIQYRCAPVCTGAIALRFDCSVCNTWYNTWY